jgi:hypothetical protein
MKNFEDRRTFPVFFIFTETDTRHLPTRLNDNTPLRSEQTPDARYVGVPLIVDDTSFDAFTVVPTVRACSDHVKGLDDPGGGATIVDDVDVSAACKGAPTVAVAALTNTTTHINTRILFIHNPAITNSPAETAKLLADFSAGVRL